MWMRISLDPENPIAGQPVRLSVLTFSQTSSRCWDDPRASPIPISRWYGAGGVVDLDLHVLAQSPGADQLTTRLAQRPGSGAYWDGTITFPSAGEWTLYTQIAGQNQPPGEGSRCGGFERTVRVFGDSEPIPIRPQPKSDPAPAQSVWPDWHPAAAALAPILTLTLILLATARLRRSG
jgi:hypothetical protein